jgi:penicillin amidase
VDVSEYLLEGLVEPVEVLVDEWGVPHLYAANDHDVYFAQGFNAARDRLFQIDLWRRRGLGLLAEVFGSSCVEQDRAARLFLYRGDMAAEWTAYGEATERIATAFVAGINSYVDLCAREPSLLPEEFGQLGYEPDRWRAEDVARIRSHGLYQNLEQEVARARTLAAYGPEVEDLRRVREPAVEIVVPDGLDLAVIPEDVLAVYRLATSPPIIAAGGTPTRPEGQGSNNWVISGSRSATGRPLLANDPHRSISLPGLRYIAHLNTPTMDVIGAGEPALPGLSIGHNDTVAFGLTIFSIDQEDLYVYETKPGEPSWYRYGDGWEQMRDVVEEVQVHDEGAVPVTLTFTRHGPVIYTDPQRNLAFAVRAAWLEPGMAPYLGSVDYMGANTWTEFLAAMNRWGSPGENQLYADVRGNIGWAPAGRVPVRPNWDGLLPVPGDGRFEWAGYYAADQLPRSYNPEAGWFATANEMNLPADYPNDERTVGYDWYSPVRYQRIAERLTELSAATVQDCVELQTDYVSLPARTLVSFLRTIEDVESDELKLLCSWDGEESVASAAAALFEIWYRRHFRPACLRAVLEQYVPPDHLDAALDAVLPAEEDTGDSRVDLAVVADPERFLGPRGTARLQQIAVAALVSATEEASRRLGPDRQAWRWGDLHHALLAHPVLDAFGPKPPAWTAIGPLPRGGSGDTVGATTYLEEFRQGVGSTFRLVVDVGNWDASVAMNSPGQSGRPSDPHYQDLFGTWAADGHFPLLYSRAAVEAHTTQRYLLRPAKPMRGVGK